MQIVSGPFQSERSVYLRGYANDAGVLANFGRAGAAMGPQSFRRIFYKMTACSDLEIIDGGDFASPSPVHEAHKQARDSMPKVPAALTVSLGGGHDWAVLDFDIPDIQIIHVDTHLDVRPFVPNQPHSGMAFRYLVEKGAKVWCFGAQEEYHSREQWDFALSTFKGMWSLNDLERAGEKCFDKCFTELDPLKPIALSLDLDAFPQSVSPGVSAPSPRGISLLYVAEIIDAVAKNLSYVGFYELNPKFDQDDQSARLGAYLLSRVLMKKFE